MCVTCVLCNFKSNLKKKNEVPPGVNTTHFKALTDGMTEDILCSSLRDSDSDNVVRTTRLENIGRSRRLLRPNRRNLRHQRPCTRLRRHRRRLLR